MRITGTRVASVADILALPFWLVLLAYFYRKTEPLTLEEKVLVAFGCSGLLIDGGLTVRLLLGGQ